MHKKEKLFLIKQQDNATIYFVNATLDKGKPNKNEISNFRPVSILNTSSKIYEKVMKNQLVSGLHKYCSPFISTYRKGYSTHHISTRLAEEWRE